MILIKKEAWSPTKQAPQILVIDDSAIDRQLVIKAIRQHGFNNEILEACDGDEALKILSENYKSIGLICLDWQMPNVDGMEFMRGVVKLPEVKSIPIVMVTASGSQEAKNCARRVNPKLGGYIVKPFKPERLINILSPFLS